MNVFGVGLILEVLLKIWDVVQEMASQAGIVILLILLCRLFVRNISKKACYFLWAIVAIRLLCPIMVPSEFSIFNTFEDKNVVRLENEASAILQLETSDKLSDSNVLQGNGIVGEGVVSEQQLSEIEKQPINPANGVVNMGNGSILGGNPTGIGSVANVINITFPFLLWMIGMSIMLTYGIFAYWRLKRKLRFATKIEDGVFESEQIVSPFVFGVLKPVIYLPLRLEEREREYILAHERYHIKRRDYLIKLLAYGLLSVYWFQPLVWVSFYLMSRDMEMSCDEQVIKSLEVDERKAYSMLLLSFASGKRFPLPSPLAFGENDTKSRIKQILNYKSPTLWGILIAFFLIVIVAVACLTDAKDDNHENDLTEQISDSAFLTDKDIQKLAEKLFERKNAYIGDVVANGKLLNAIFEPLKITDWNGSELQTREEPFWISLTFDTKPNDEKMWQASAMFLALVENANEVRWSFYDEYENFTTYYVTVDSIKEALGGIAIKEYSVSVEKIAELWNMLKETRDAYSLNSKEDEKSKLVSVTAWDRYAIDAGLDFTERIEWENRLNKDNIGYRGDSGLVQNCVYQDFEQNGMKDLIVILRDLNWDYTIDGRFCIYMNDEPVYIYDLPYMGAFWNVTTADIDNDGFIEFLFYGDSGGTGGFGFNAIFELLKYKNGTFETMPLPLDEYCDAEDETAGFGIEVYTAAGNGNYVAYCPAIEERIEFSVGNAFDEVFESDTPENTLVGRERYGFHRLMPILQDGQYYLLAEESIYRIDIYQRMQSIGTAQFLLSWEDNVGWIVNDFDVYAGGDDIFHTMKNGLEYYPDNVEELQKRWHATPIIYYPEGSIYDPENVFMHFVYTTSRNLTSNNIVYAKQNEKGELAYVSIEYRNNKYYYVEDYSRCTDRPYYFYGDDYYQKVYTNAVHFAMKYSDGSVFEHFYLTNEENLTEKDIFDSLLSSQYPPELDFVSVYTKKLDEEGMKYYTKYTGDFIEQGIKITMPSKHTWVGDPLYELVDNVICGTYNDNHIYAAMNVYVGEEDAVFEKARAGLKENLSEWDYETWTGRTKDGEYVEIALYLEPNDTTGLYTVAAKWEYEGNTYLIYGDTEEAEGSTVAKTAICIIEHFEKHE